MILKDGKEVECDILFTFDCEHTGKAYIGYCDNIIADNERKNIYVSSYNPNAENIVFENIENPEEMKMVQDVLIQLDEDSKR